LVGTE